jgi:Ran GTPase-activating protein (RanGAP) involved in mRNA processing and transport|tara:strand:- start:10608 stop:10790 length:183 start_codon:yes stop_codon:yes gene_type:complete
MKIKIKKTAKNNGVPSAFVVKVGNLKFPRGFKDWYFTTSKSEALGMALQEWKDLYGDNHG